jgi:hypothetical protein
MSVARGEQFRTVGSHVRIYLHDRKPRIEEIKAYKVDKKLKTMEQDFE